MFADGRTGVKTCLVRKHKSTATGFIVESRILSRDRSTDGPERVRGNHRSVRAVNQAHRGLPGHDGLHGETTVLARRRERADAALP